MVDLRIFTAEYKRGGVSVQYRIFSLNSLAPNIPVIATSAQVRDRGS